MGLPGKGAQPLPPPSGVYTTLRTGHGAWRFRTVTQRLPSFPVIFPLPVIFPIPVIFPLTVISDLLGQRTGQVQCHTDILRQKPTGARPREAAIGPYAQTNQLG